ncbi:MAG: glycosyltransferase [Anaerolineaceae bacterium]|nr:glycosyltransferase [Anaerolineaceae bacterium]
MIRCSDLSVSVITPSFNQAAYLKQTMDSVLSQDIPGMEYVVMDGGSADGSVELIRSYEDRLTGWVSEKDRGQADAVNKGAARTKGDVIGWLNSDDLYLPGAIRKALDHLAAHPEIDAVYGDVLSIDGEGKLINVMRFGQYEAEDLMSFRVISQPGVFFRRSAWERAGGLDLSYHYLLDHHLWLRMIAGGKFAYLPEPLAAARFHAEAKNRAHTEDFGKEAYRLADWLLSDPLTAERAKPIENRIRGGAAWLDAHYLSDGGDAVKSLKAYAKAMRLFPERVTEDKNRLALTLLMVFNKGAADKVFKNRSSARLENLKEYEEYLKIH